MKYSIVICLTILLTSPAVFSAGSEEKEPEGTDRLAEADRLFNQGLQHRDRAWEYEKQAEGALKPKDRDVYLKSAEREFKRALKAFKSATKQNSRHYEAFGSLGYAQRKVGKFKDALKSYDRALKMKPDYPEALEYRAEAYLGLNRIDDAKIDYEKLVKLDQDNARTFLDAASKWLLITITPRKRLGSLDTGPGIPEEKQAGIFEPFQQEKEGLRQGGTGLGLAISSGHVAMMGGSIGVESRLGEGSLFTFTLTLPQGQVPTGSSDTVAWSNVQGLAEGQTVRALVVDDVETNRELLSQMLTQIGVEVETAENGALGLESVGREMPDVVFLDIRMPVMDGPEMLERMQRAYGKDSAVVVAVTASVFDHQRQAYLDMGFAAFLSKPLEAERIYQCLSEDVGVKLTFSESESDLDNEAVGRDWTDFVLSPELYEDLASAVEQYSITELRRGLDRLKGEAPDLAAHLGGLASQFDMEGIKTVLDEIHSE